MECHTARRGYPTLRMPGAPKSLAILFQMLVTISLIQSVLILGLTAALFVRIRRIRRVERSLSEESIRAGTLRFERDRLTAWAKSATEELAKRSNADLQRERKKLEKENTRLQHESELSRARHAAENEQTLRRYQEKQAWFLTESQRKKDQLTADYQEALARYTDLKKEVEIVEESLEDISFGVYRPHFTFESTEAYQLKINELRIQQRSLIRTGRAAVCSTAWTVNSSMAEGKRMIKSHSKLLLRAFNGECDAAIAKVTWNNVSRMEERIRKCFRDLNQLGNVEKISISEIYMVLKVEELLMTYEQEQKRYDIRDEQRRMRERIRDEEKARQDIAKALEESETDEHRYAVAIANAKDRATAAMGEKLAQLQAQIGQFE